MNVEDRRKPASFQSKLHKAAAGIFYGVRTEPHLRFHFFAAACVVLVAYWLKITRWEWLLIIYAIGGVWIAELFNTALEQVVDLAEPGFHPLAGLAKDVASGAVLVAALQAVLIGTLIFWPYLF